MQGATECEREKKKDFRRNCKSNPKRETGDKPLVIGIHLFQELNVGQNSILQC